MFKNVKLSRLVNGMWGAFKALLICNPMDPQDRCIWVTPWQSKVTYKDVNMA